MNRDEINKQVMNLNIPYLCRITVTVALHSRGIEIYRDSRDCVNGMRERLCNRAKAYYRGSKAACREAYKAMKEAISEPHQEQCTQ